MKIAHLESDAQYSKELDRVFKNEQEEGLEGDDYLPVTTTKELLSFVSLKSVDCILLSINQTCEQILGHALIAYIRCYSESIPIIILLQENDSKSLLELRGLGATDCFSKKDSISKIIGTVKLMMEKRKVSEASPGPVKRLYSQEKYFVGSTLHSFAERVVRIFNSGVKSVLITGESGTGKEIIAEMFKDQLTEGEPFVALNCATISSDLIYGDLFGCRKGFSGSFSDARQGLLSTADKGILFLDEIACLSLEVQSALLRVLEHGEVRVIGSHLTQQINLRVIATTNENLDEKVKEGTFRGDLLQRLRQYEISLPALRQRPQGEREEILEFYMHKLNTQMGREFELGPEVRMLCLRCPWSQGNLRELWNFLFTCVVNVEIGNLITIGSLSKETCEQVLGKYSDCFSK